MSSPRRQLSESCNWESGSAGRIHWRWKPGGLTSSSGQPPAGFHGCLVLSPESALARPQHLGVPAGWASDSQTLTGCPSPALAHSHLVRGTGGCRLVYTCTHTPSSSRPHSHLSPHAGGVRGCGRVGLPSGVLTPLGSLFLQAPFCPLRHGLHLAFFPPWRHPGATLRPTEEWPPVPASVRRFAGPRR